MCIKMLRVCGIWMNVAWVHIIFSMPLPKSHCMSVHTRYTTVHQGFLKSLNVWKTFFRASWAGTWRHSRRGRNCAEGKGKICNCFTTLVLSPCSLCLFCLYLWSVSMLFHTPAPQGINRLRIAYLWPSWSLLRPRQARRQAGGGAVQLLVLNCPSTQHIAAALSVVLICRFLNP